MDYETIEWEPQGEVGILRFNRPRIVNAMNRQMVRELGHFWTERQRDDETRVLILTGAGDKGFCSGLDMKEATQPRDERSERADAVGRSASETMLDAQTRLSEIIRQMRAAPQPIIAAVHGPAMGAGFSFALAADVRIACDDAMFCAQYINIGLGGADMGSSYLLWRAVGSSHASEMCLTGRRVFAEEALRIGLVNRLVPRAQLLDSAREMAKEMASKSRLGLRMTKDALNAAFNASSLEDALRMEDRNQVILVTSGLLRAADPPRS